MTTLTEPPASAPAVLEPVARADVWEEFALQMMVATWGRLNQRRFPVWPPVEASYDQLLEFWADPAMEEDAK